MTAYETIWLYVWWIHFNLKMNSRLSAKSAVFTKRVLLSICSLSMSIRINRSIHSSKEVLLKNSQNSQENTCARFPILQLYQKQTQTQVLIRVNFAKFLITIFLWNTSGGCFLNKTLILPITRISSVFWIETTPELSNK